MSAHTPGPWTAARMTLEGTDGESMTPDQIGVYVSKSVEKSATLSGTFDFLIVTCEKPDGPADVCHVGNGPTSQQNARLIAAAPELLAAAKLASLNFKRSLASGNDLYDDDHEAWTALNKAIDKAEGR